MLGPCEEPVLPFVDPTWAKPNGSEPAGYMLTDGERALSNLPERKIAPSATQSWRMFMPRTQGRVTEPMPATSEIIAPFRTHCTIGVTGPTFPTVTTMSHGLLHQNGNLQRRPRAATHYPGLKRPSGTAPCAALY